MKHTEIQERSLKVIHDGDIRDRMVDGDMDFILGNWPRMTLIQRDYINTHAMGCGFLPITEDLDFRFSASSSYVSFRDADTYKNSECLAAHLCYLPSEIAMYIGIVWSLEHAVFTQRKAGLEKTREYLEWVLDSYRSCDVYLHRSPKDRLSYPKPVSHLIESHTSVCKHDGNRDKSLGKVGHSAALSACRKKGSGSILQWKKSQLKRASDVCLQASRTGKHVLFTDPDDFIRKSISEERSV